LLDLSFYNKTLGFVKVSYEISRSICKKFQEERFQEVYFLHSL